MKYYDENDVEIPESEIDYELGKVELDSKVIEHHEAVEEVPRITHYTVDTFYFDDDTSLTMESEDDPHIKVIDNKAGVFEYVDQGEGKVYFGADLKEVVDQEYVAPQEAYDEIEEFYRWIPYTEEELEEQRKNREIAEKRQEFIENGADRLDSVETDLSNTTEQVDSLGAELGDLSVAFVELMESI